MALQRSPRPFRSSGISRAKPSIISTASRVPEMIKSSSLVSSSSCVGNGTNSPSTRPRRTEPSGPWNGSGEMPSAARGTVHRQHVAVGLAIAGHHEVLNLHFVVEAFGKQRPDRAIDQPRGQRFLGRRPAFTLEKAAGKLAGRGDAARGNRRSAGRNRSRAAAGRWQRH